MSPETLVRSLTQHLGDKTSFACERITDTQGLHETELAAVARAVPKRQAEFAAGRRAARRALSAQGMANAPILTDDSRAPKWPNGFVGSITHDQGLALAAVAKTSNIKALGIDLTEAAPLPGRTRDSILHSENETKLDDLQARAAFAVKECLFKTLYTDVQSFFGFEAAIATPDLRNQSFSARLTTDLGPYPSGATFSGVLLSSKTLIVAALAIPA